MSRLLLGLGAAVAAVFLVGSVEATIEQAQAPVTSVSTSQPVTSLDATTTTASADSSSTSSTSTTVPPTTTTQLASTLTTPPAPTTTLPPVTVPPTTLAPEPEVTEPPAVESGVEQWRDLVSGYGWNADIALCLMDFESGGNPDAYNDSSGASGLMQVLASWADNFGYSPADLFDPVVNLDISYALYVDGGWSHWSPWNRGECH